MSFLSLGLRILFLRRWPFGFVIGEHPSAPAFAWAARGGRHGHDVGRPGTGESCLLFLLPKIQARDEAMRSTFFFSYPHVHRVP